jgi:hypothetical protein
LIATAKYVVLGDINGFGAHVAAIGTDHISTITGYIINPSFPNDPKRTTKVTGSGESIGYGLGLGFQVGKTFDLSGLIGKDKDLGSTRYAEANLHLPLWIFNIEGNALISGFNGNNGTGTTDREDVAIGLRNIFISPIIGYRREGMNQVNSASNLDAKTSDATIYIGVKGDIGKIKELLEK